MTKHVTRFKTDEKGRVPDGLNLVPGAVYSLTTVVPPTARPIPSVTELVGWIRVGVLGDLRTLKEAVSHREQVATLSPSDGGHLGGGNYLLAAGCSMALEYMARIYQGRDAAPDNVRSYVRRFLAPIDSRYGRVGILLWSSLRNGIVHGSWPQSICLEGNEQKRVSVGVSVTMTDPHLELVVQNGKELFGVNALQLFDDLNRSFEDGLVPWLNGLVDPTKALDRAGPRLMIVRQGNHDGVQGFQFINDLRAVCDATG